MKKIKNKIYLIITSIKISNPIIYSSKTNSKLKITMIILSLTMISNSKKGIQKIGNHNSLHYNSK